jgi:Coenzyme PQQ synthesis protein D (PqqD)
LTVVKTVPASAGRYQGSALWKLSPDVVFRDLEGEAVILDLASGTYFGLNEVGTRVWRLVDEGRSTSQIVEIVTAEYEADREIIARDVERLIDDLHARRLIVSAGTVPP